MRFGVHAALLCVPAAFLGVSARADETRAKAVIEKAIGALGGEEKLAAVKAFSATGKGTIVLDGEDHDFTFEMIAQGVEKYRSSYEVEVSGNKFEGGTVLDGEKGWMKSDDKVETLDGDALAAEKRNAYLDVVPMLLVPLKGKGFKVVSAGDDKVDGKAAVAVRATGPEGKEFTLTFDAETGLPVRMSGVVAKEEGEEALQETTFEDYQEVDGIKVATRSRVKRAGKRFIDVEGVKFKSLRDVEPGTFAEPK